MSERNGNSDGGLLGRETQFPTLVPLNHDRGSSDAAAVAARQRAHLRAISSLRAAEENRGQVLDVVDGDDHLVEVVDLDGDGHIDSYELAVGMVADWGDVADSIDERIAESPSWPALNTVLAAASESGYDVAANLPHVAGEAPLPLHDPAGELYYRLLNNGDLDLATDTGNGVGVEPPARRDEPCDYTVGTPAISATRGIGR